MINDVVLRAGLEFLREPTFAGFAKSGDLCSGQVEIAADRPFVLYLNRTPMQVAAGFSRVAARKTGGHGGRSRLCPAIAGLRRPRLHDDRSG